MWKDSHLLYFGNDERYLVPLWHYCDFDTVICDCIMTYYL